MKEVWKDVIGYEGKYEVSNKGRVRSLRKITDKVNRLRPKPLILKQQKIKSGHKRLMLCINNTEKMFFVHRLVASTFLSNQKNLPQVNHINGNPADNKIENLKWVTASENVLHSFRVLEKKPLRGELNGQSKFTEKDILKIRILCKTNMTLSEIAKIFNTSHQYISEIKNRKKWAHI